MSTDLNHASSDLQRFAVACGQDAVLPQLTAFPREGWTHRTDGLNHDGTDLQRFAAACGQDALISELAASPFRSWAGLNAGDRSVN